LDLLENLHAQTNDGPRIPLRIGLNSSVDTLVPDINGTRTVVGDGINVAQRVMNLARAGQILMHDQVRINLSNYPVYRNKLVACGGYPVKHGVRLPIAQYIDPELDFLTKEPLAPPPAEDPPPVDLDQILQRRVSERVLALSIDGSELDFLPEISGFVETHLEANPAFRPRRFAVAWLVTELLDNALRHGRLGQGQKATVTLERSVTGGLMVTVGQPNLTDFSLKPTLADPANSDSFLQIINRAGIRLRERRRDGALEICLEIPLDFDLGPLSNLQASPTPLRKQATVFEPEMGRIDETSWLNFSQQLHQAVIGSAASGSNLLVDLGQVDYMSSRGLRALTLARRAADQAGIEIALFNLNSRMAEILAISRYDKLFAIYKDATAAGIPR
jgi:anti-anti-sigma factor